MGRRGPPPTPTAILEKRGSWLAKTRGKEPREYPAAGKEPAPKWLGAMARHAWRELVRVLGVAGVLKKTDLRILARYCDAWEKWRRAQEKCLEAGEWLVTVDDAGFVDSRVAAWAIRADRLSEQMTKLERELGLTPSARTRIEVETNGKDDGKDEGKGRFFAGAVG